MKNILKLIKNEKLLFLFLFKKIISFSILNYQ